MDGAHRPSPPLGSDAAGLRRRTRLRPVMKPRQQSAGGVKCESLGTRPANQAPPNPAPWGCWSGGTSAGRLCRIEKHSGQPCIRRRSTLAPSHPSPAASSSSPGPRDPAAVPDVHRLSRPRRREGVRRKGGRGECSDGRRDDCDPSRSPWPTGALDQRRMAAGRWAAPEYQRAGS
jgi:hypothetical protein